MKGITISHSSAARFWSSHAPEYLLQARDFKFPNSRIQFAPFSSFKDASGTLIENGHFVDNLIGSKNCIHILRPRDNAINCSSLSKAAGKNIAVHYHSNALPKGHLVHLFNDVYITSPELTFVQYATENTIFELLKLGYKLCGTSLDYEKIQYNKSNNFQTITSCKVLKDFIQSNPEIFGSRQALYSLRFIRDNSASPMETACTLFLCLPYKLGGYGIPFPELNQKIQLKHSVKKITSHHFFVADLYWKEEGVIAEYDSDQFHSNRASINKDIQRANLLELNGHKVITITKKQLLNRYEFEQTATLIAQELNHRIRLPHGFRTKQTRLRKELLSNSFPN